MTDIPRVSIIILNWNGLSDTVTCLESLKKITYPNYDVIVIDNGSSDNDADILEVKFAGYIHLIRNDKNYGFAKGNNIGITKAFEDNSVKYIATLNNDTIVMPQWLDELVRCAEIDASIGSCASKMLYYHRPTIINAAGDLILKDGSGINRGRNEPDKGQYDKEEEVFGACAGAALYSREMLNKIGLFDPDYFAYNEDLDLAWRARLAGWICMYVPSAVVYHVHSASTVSFPAFKIYHGERNRIWTLIKNFPIKHILIATPYTVMKLFLHLLSALRKKGRGSDYARNVKLSAIVLSLLRAWIDASVNLPKFIKKRRNVQSLRKVPINEIDLWLKKYSIRLSETSIK
jgi:GT2 family glycosyltransferase